MNAVPIPLSDPIARPARPEYRGRKDPLEGTVTQPWVDYLTDQGDQQTHSSTTISSVSLVTQSASIGATDLSDGTLATGLYRVSWYTRITQAASVSSSLTVTIDWTDGTSPSYSGAAVTGNTTTTIQSDTLMIQIDNLSPVRYSTTYASVGGTPMEYKLIVLLEVVGSV